MRNTLGANPPAGNGHRQSVVTDRLQELLGLHTARTAHKVELAAPDQVAALLQACVEKGQRVRAQQILDRYIRIVHPQAAPCPNEALILEAQQADLAEDQLEHEALVTKTPEARRRWRRARAVAREANDRLDRALDAAEAPR